MADGYMPAAKSVDHISPRVIATRVEATWRQRGIDLDPFASRSVHSTIEAKRRYFGPHENDVDGLEAEWSVGESQTRVYFNCPYGRFMAKAVAKARREFEAGMQQSAKVVRIIGLLKACTDTRWFQDDVCGSATAVCFVRGRLHYIDGATGKAGPAPFASIVVLWDPYAVAQFVESFGDIGRVVRLRGGL